METKTITPAILPVTIAATLAALGAFIGVLWDIATHIDLGRDTFFSPPHLMIVGSLAFGINASIVIAMIQGKRPNIGVVDQTLSGLRRPLLRLPFGIEITHGSLLSIVAVVIVSLSFPLDEFWHRVFGVDITLWSPPHVILILSGFTAAWGLTLQLVDEMNLLNPSRLRPGLRQLRKTDRGTWALIAGNGIFLSAMLLMTAEYDFDVPQFNLIWHPVVLVGISAFVLALSRRAIDRRFAATIVAAVATAARLIAVVVLLVIGRSIAHVALLFVPALFVDLIDRSGERRRHPAISGAIFAAGTVLVEFAWLRIAGRLVWSGRDAVIGGAISAAVGAIMWTIGDRAGRALRPNPEDHRRRRPLTRSAVVAGLFGCVALVIPGIAVGGPSDEIKVEFSTAVRPGEPFDVRVSLPEGAQPTLVQFARAQHRITRAATVDEGGGTLARNFVIPTEGTWGILVRYDLGGSGYLADIDFPVPLTGRELVLLAESDDRSTTMPSWFGAAAWAMIAAVTLAMIAILIRSFRSIEQGALAAMEPPAPS